LFFDAVRFIMDVAMKRSQIQDESLIKGENGELVERAHTTVNSKAAFIGKPELNFQHRYWQTTPYYCNWIHPNVAELIFEENRKLLNGVKEVKRRARRKVKLLIKKIQFLNARLLCQQNPRAWSHMKSFNYCARCSKYFSSHFTFARHLRTHTAERPYKCNLCLKMFGTKWHLTRHNLIHKRPFKCTHCDRTFAFKIRLTRHLGSAHLKCSHCSITFAKRSELENHMKGLQGVPGTEIWRCDLCSKTFVRKFHMQRHMRIHTNEKPFKCSQCPRAFSRKDYLNKHTLVHDTERNRMIEMRELRYSYLYQARRIQMLEVKRHI